MKIEFKKSTFIWFQIFLKPNKKSANQDLV